MLQSRIKIDYSIFEKKMGKLGTKVIPRARITAQYIAKYGLKAVITFTKRGATHSTPKRGSRYRRTPGRVKIANLWQLAHSRKAYMDVYTISNLYPDQEVIVFFEEGTKHHKIPKSPMPEGKFLYWIDEESGEKVFSKQVDHPGMEATRMVERTENQIIKPRVADWMKQTLAMTDQEMR